MTSPGPADVAAIASRTYFALGPILGTHSACRCFASIAAGVATALDVPHVVFFEREYVEAGRCTPHFWLEFETGEVLDYWGRVRLMTRAPADEDRVS